MSGPARMCNIKSTHMPHAFVEGTGLAQLLYSCPGIPHPPASPDTETAREERCDEPDRGEDGLDQMTRRLRDAWNRGYEARAGQKPFTSNPWRH